jgi:glycogen synthase
MRNGMARDFSWTNSAREYVRIYEKSRQLRSVHNGEVVTV